MRRSGAEFVIALASRGWAVQRAVVPSALPAEISSRYPWLPLGLVAAIGEFTLIVSPNETSWWNTAPELRGESDSAFAWNEWELQSLNAAEDDLGWQTAIRNFWDRHFPFLVAVQPKYGYLAVRDDQKIVRGEEPEFEETEVIADDFESFLQRLVDGDEHFLSFF